MTTEGQMVVRLDRLTHKPWGISIGYGAIGLSWLYLNLPTLQWFGQVFQDISQFNGWMLGVGGLLLLFQVFRHWHRFQDGFQAAPQTGFRFAPVLLMVGSGVAAIGIRWLVDFEQLPALLFLLGTYGLVGLFLAEPLWRKGLPVAGLVALVVPFGVQFSLGLGFPARILTAHTVESILANLNIAALSSEDIIVLDTGIAQVDLPCSGLKSLWTGTLLLLGATWIEGRQIGLRWLLVCLTNLALLVLVNMVRVLVLVVVAAVLNQPAIAEILHVPLGLFGFITVCLVAWGLLRLVPWEQGSGGVGSREWRMGSRESGVGSGAAWLFQWDGRTTRSFGLSCFALTIAFITLALIPLPAGSIALSLNQLAWPPQMQMQSVPLSEIEQEFFISHPGTVAQENRFQFQDISGSLLLVSSPTWRAHHPPELCYISSGFQLNHMERQQLTPSILGRWLALDDHTRSAAYWFQSVDRTTDDYLSRIWGEVTRKEQTWTMVSILFDHPQTPGEPAVQAFLNAVHKAIDS